MESRTRDANDLYEIQPWREAPRFICVAYLFKIVKSREVHLGLKAGPEPDIWAHSSPQNIGEQSGNTRGAPFPSQWMSRDRGPSTGADPSQGGSCCHAPPIGSEKGFETQLHPP